MKTTIQTLVFILLLFEVNCAFSQIKESSSFQRGDQGNGVYIHSVLKADYSDPGVVHTENADGWEDPCPFWDGDGTTYLV